MTDLSPTPLTDERLAELSAALFGYCVGGCGCMTKTPEASQHLPTCLYRVCWESAVFIAQARRSLAERDARIAELEKALSDLIANGQFGVHRGHFDWTGEHGRGCEVCIKQRAARMAAETALTEQQPKEQT